MSQRRLLVFGDGEHELGAKSDRGCDLEPALLASLPRLVHRLLDKPASTSYQPRPFRDVRPVHERGHKYARKVKRAILQASQGRFDGLVVVMDRDRNHPSATAVPMREGRDGMAHSGYPPCAVGVAVETFDAWMIADGKAVGVAGGDASRSHPAPETLDGEEGTGRHPKDRAVELFGGSGALTEAYAKVASCVDLELLGKCCPQGFAPFAQEVRERIGPVVAAP